MISWNIKIIERENIPELAEEIRIAYITSYIKPETIFINSQGMGDYLFDVLKAETNLPVQKI